MLGPLLLLNIAAAIAPTDGTVGLVLYLFAFELVNVIDPYLKCYF